MQVRPGTNTQMAPGSLSCTEQPVSTLPFCLAARAVVGANAGRERVSSASPVLDALAPLVLRHGAAPRHSGEHSFPVLQRGKVPRDFYANPSFS